MKLILLIGIIVLIGCVENVDADTKKAQLVDAYNTVEKYAPGIIVVYLPDQNVTCFQLNNHIGGGLDCMEGKK